MKATISGGFFRVYPMEITYKLDGNGLPVVSESQAKKIERHVCRSYGKGRYRGAVGINFKMHEISKTGNWVEFTDNFVRVLAKKVDDVLGIEH